MRIHKLMSGLALALLFFAGEASAGNIFEFAIKRGASPLSTLNWKDLVVEVDIRQEAPNVYRFDALLSGSFIHQDASILYNYQQIKVSPETGRFEMAVKIRGPSTPLQLISIDAMGIPQEEKVLLVATKWKEMLQFLADGGVHTMGTHYSAGLNFVSQQYSQTQSVGFNQGALGGKFSVVRPFWSRAWYWDANIYGTLAPLYNSVSGLKLRTVGINARVGHKLYDFSNKVSLWAQGG